MKRRLVASMVLVAVFAVVLFGVPLGVAAGRLFRRREVSRLEREATRAAGSVPAGGLPGPDAIGFPRAVRGEQLALYDTGGRRVAGVGPTAGDTAVASAIGGRVADDHDRGWLAVAVPLQHDKKVVGVARAAAPWKMVTDDTHTTWLVMGALGATAVAVAGAFALAQSSRLVVPVRGVSAMAVRLGDGDFSARVPPSGVPELDQAGEALNRTAGRLGRLVARERAFTTDVSHQLTTPLTSLRLGLESALITPGDDTAATIERAIIEVDRLHGTVATLLAVARDTPLDGAASCDVARVCRDAADRCRGELAAVGRALHTDLDPALPPGKCPPEVLREILAVVVDNARLHGAGTVGIVARRAGPGAVIDVSDEGRGLAVDVNEIFLRRPADAAGHGIGLALARSLAEAHNARLEVSRSGPEPVFSIAVAGVTR